MPQAATVVESERVGRCGDPCVMVIFGASGDLTRRKLIPSLYNLAKYKLLSREFAVIGVARNAMSIQEFRAKLAQDLISRLRARLDFRFRRRVAVGAAHDRREAHWMTAEEFNETFSLSQFLPGPNVVNFSVVFGSRFGGAAGAAVALAGLLGPPLVIVTVLAALYAHFGDLEVLTRILGGIASAAAGLIIAKVAKMAEPMFRKRWNFAPFVAIAGFIAVALMRWPLPYVFAVLAPVSVAFAWLSVRR